MTTPLSVPTPSAMRGPSALALLDHLSDIVIVIDAHGRLCYANEACATFLGRPAEELCGTNALDLIHPEDRELALDALTQTRAKGPGIRHPLTVRIGVGDGAAGSGDTTSLMELMANNLLDTPEVRGIVICARDVTGRAERSRRLDHEPTNADFSLDRAPSACAVIDADGCFTRVNPAMLELTGFTTAELIGRRASELTHPDELQDELAIAARMSAEDTDANTRERRLLRSDGSIVWVRRTYWVLRNTDGSVRCVNVSMVDLTEQRATEEHAVQLNDILETSRELVFITDAVGGIQYANRRGRELLGLNQGDQPQLRLDGYMAAETITRIPDQIVPVLEADGVWTGELTLLATTGEEIPVACTIQLHRDESGVVTRVSAIAHDIRELKRAQRLLEHQARHDALTMLPNRQLFQEMGEQALARADRDGTTVAVLFLDLDRFKHVNDTYGHPVGDKLLVEVATRLRDAVRRGDVLARFGGDEFVVCCEHPAGRPEMLDLAERLIGALSRPVELDGITADVGVSIGIAIGAGSRVTIDTLLRDADVALYRAKEQGRGRAVIFGTSASTELA